MVDHILLGGFWMGEVATRYESCAMVNIGFTVCGQIYIDHISVNL